MKQIIIICWIAFTAQMLCAQNTFFPTKAGTIQVYAQKNSKGKIESYSKQTVKDVQGADNNMVISYVMEPLDKDQKSANPPVEIPCKITIKDGVMILDMTEMFANMQKDQQVKDIAQMEITGVPMEIRSDLQPGQSLKDANMSMTMNLGIMKMTTAMNFTEGKCLAIEDITVPAGTFKCHKITQKCTTTVMKRNIVSKTVSWYSVGIGTVKTESYDDKDKLQSNTELVVLK